MFRCALGCRTHFPALVGPQARGHLMHLHEFVACFQTQLHMYFRLTRHIHAHHVQVIALVRHPCKNSSLVAWVYRWFAAGDEFHTEIAVTALACQRHADICFVVLVVGFLARHTAIVRGMAVAASEHILGVVYMARRALSLCQRSSLSVCSNAHCRLCLHADDRCTPHR